MPCKVDYADLESVTKFLDKYHKAEVKVKGNVTPLTEEAAKLSKMIKDKYTEIKPHYDRAN